MCRFNPDWWRPCRKISEACLCNPPAKRAQRPFSGAAQRRILARFCCLCWRAGPSSHQAAGPYRPSLSDRLAKVVEDQQVGLVESAFGNEASRTASPMRSTRSLVTWNDTDMPSRQAWWPKADASQVLPTPVGPRIMRFCFRVIQLQLDNLEIRDWANPRLARVS